MKTPQQLNKEIEDALAEYLWKSNFVDSAFNRELLKSVVEDNYGGVYSQGHLKQAGEDVEGKLQPKISPEAKARAEEQAKIVNEDLQCKFLTRMFDKYPLLVANQDNVDVVDAWCRRVLDGNYPKESSIDAGVDSCAYTEKSKLYWKAPPLPTPPEPIIEEPPEPEEKLERLKDGTRQLPINCSEWVMLKASKAQLADLANRQWALRSNAKAKDPTRVGSAF